MSRLLEQINNKERSHIKLSEVADIVPGFSFKSSDFVENGTPLVKITEIQTPYVVLDKCSFIDTLKYPSDKLSKFYLKNGEYVVAMTGATVGKVGKVISNENLLLNQRVAVVRPKGEVCKEFVNMQISSPKFEAYIKRIASGSSAQANISGTDIGDFEFNIPDISTQKKIAEILSAYDAKIENNNKIIKNLESTAQTIFNEWFVNFKFPGYEKVKMVDSEMGEIPEGWEIFNMKDIFTFVKGKKPKEISDTEKEGFLQQILIDSFEGGKKLFANKEGMVIASEEDLLMVMDGASSGRIEFGIFGVVGSTLSKLNLKKSVRTILYFYLKSKEKDIKENTTGSAIPHTDKDKVYNYEIALPQDIDFFENNLFRFVEYIKNLKDENLFLKSQRDQLLAKLI